MDANKIRLREHLRALLSVANKKIVEAFMPAKPAKYKRRRHSLESMVSRIPKNYQPSEQWEAPAGNEAW